jgi:V/A-type H+-transporting ATPase subunit K
MKISARRARIVLLSTMVLAVVLAIVTSMSLVTRAQGGATTSSTSTAGWRYVGAGLAVGLAGLGGGYAVGVAGASAVSAIAEKREVSGMALLIVALGEGIAIYGLLIGILVLVLK